MGLVGGQLQASAQVTPRNSSDTVLTLMVAATDGKGITYAGANAVVSGNGSSEGQTVTALAFSDIYNVQQYGVSILGVIQGMLLTSSGTCFYAITRSFDVG